MRNIFFLISLLIVTNVFSQKYRVEMEVVNSEELSKGSKSYSIGLGKYSEQYLNGLLEKSKTGKQLSLYASAELNDRISNEKAEQYLEKIANGDYEWLKVTLVEDWIIGKKKIKSKLLGIGFQLRALESQNDIQFYKYISEKELFEILQVQYKKSGFSNIPSSTILKKKLFDYKVLEIRKKDENWNDDKTEIEEFDQKTTALFGDYQPKKLQKITSSYMISVKMNSYFFDTLGNDQKLLKTQDFFKNYIQKIVEAVANQKIIAYDNFLDSRLENQKQFFSNEEKFQTLQIQNSGGKYPWELKTKSMKTLVDYGEMLYFITVKYKWTTSKKGLLIEPEWMILCEYKTEDDWLSDVCKIKISDCKRIKNFDYSGFISALKSGEYYKVMSEINDDLIFTYPNSIELQEVIKSGKWEKLPN